MRVKKLLLGLCAACLLLGGCAMERPAEAPPLRIVIASDLHYLSQSLTDNGPMFQQVVENGDGKLMLDIEAITEAFVWQMLEERPDYVILSGDLSFNGEYQSHADLSQKLRRLQDAGIPVLVIPGNHDIGRGCYRFAGEEAEPAEGTSAEDFRALYGDFGYAQALSRDEASGSYVIDAGGGRRIILLDTNSFSYNALPEESLGWLEKELKAAKRAGGEVITVSHQNLLVHNPLFRFGYQLMDAETLEALLAKYGVLVHLSGHMHVQHLAEGAVPEILTSPLSLVPCRYGLLNWDAAGLTYRAESVDVTAWARAQGETDGRFSDFGSYAAASFYDIAYQKIAAAAGNRGLPAGSPERMARCFAETNLAYFTGEAIDRERLREDLAFWIETAGETFETTYLATILEDESPDPLFVKLK